MKNIIFIEDQITPLDTMVIKLVEEYNINYSAIHPRIFTKREIDFSGIKNCENLKSVNYDNDFLLLKDVYKKINDENREVIYDKIFEVLEISNTSIIYIDVALVEKKQNIEGLYFLLFLIEEKKINNENIYVISVANENLVKKQLSEISKKPININHINKEGSGAYEAEIFQLIKNKMNDGL
jgi:hypothetical protein